MIRLVQLRDIDITKLRFMMLFETLGELLDHLRRLHQVVYCRTHRAHLRAAQGAGLHAAKPSITRCGVPRLLAPIDADGLLLDEISLNDIFKQALRNACIRHNMLLCEARETTFTVTYTSNE